MRHALGGLPSSRLLSLRLLRHKRGSVAVFTLLYGLGLAVFLLVDGLWRRVDKDLGARSRELLEADVQVESRRALTPAESSALASLLPPKTRQAQSWGFLSMVAGPSGTSRLVQIKAVDAAYPLYGAFTFASPFSLQDWRKGELLAPPGLMAGLGVAVGDSLRIGEKSFRIRAAYTDRPGGGFDMWELSGRIYMRLDDVIGTGLVQKGSRIFRYRFLGLAADENPRTLREGLAKSLDDPEIELRSTGDRESDLGRLLDNLGGFLKVLALGAYLLAAVGAAFFFARHLEAERPLAALLRAMGANPGAVRWIFIRQNAALAALASALGIVLAFLASFILVPLVRQAYGIELPLALPFGTVVLGAVLPLATALLFAASGLWQAGRVSPASLLRQADAPPLAWGLRVALALGQALGVLLMARLASNSWILGGGALAAMAAALGGLAFLGWAAVHVLWRIRYLLGYADRVLLGAVRLRRGRALAAFFALGFTAFAIALLPLLRQSLAEEMRAPQGQILPSLFLFDIQEEEEGRLRDLLRSLGTPLETSAPMIRARLMAINGQTFRRDDKEAATLEGRSRTRLRNRGFNLSSRPAVEPSESVVEGRFWSQAFDPDSSALAGISVERDFAAKLGLGLGDTLRFDVQGVEIEGQVTSLRRVRWNSFRPNFFVIFQPGVLDHAPKTFLGTVATANLPSASVRDSVAKSFPHVSVLEVGEALRRLDGWMARLEKMVAFLSMGYLLIGLAILITVIEGSVRDGRRSLLLLRMLGARPRDLAWAYARHYLAFGMAATSGGLLLALGAAYAVHALLWGLPFRVPWGLLPQALLMGVGIGLLAALWAISRGKGGSLRALLASSRGE